MRNRFTFGSLFSGVGGFELGFEAAGLRCASLGAGPRAAYEGTLAFSCKDHGGDVSREVAPTLRAMPHADSHANGGGQVAVAFAIQAGATRENPKSGPDGVGVSDSNCAYCVEARTEVPGVAFQARIARNGRGQPEEIVPALNGANAGETSDSRPLAAMAWGVRQLMPCECEILMGWPEGHTEEREDLTLDGNRWVGTGRIIKQKDGPRYRQCGNGVVAPVAFYIAANIAAQLEMEVGA